MRSCRRRPDPPRILHDDADVPIRDVTTVESIRDVTGVAPLTAPDGTSWTLRDPEGTWTLSVFDEAYLFEGTLTSWSLRF